MGDLHNIHSNAAPPEASPLPGGASFWPRFRTVIDWITQIRGDISCRSICSGCQYSWTVMRAKGLPQADGNVNAIFTPTNPTPCGDTARYYCDDCFPGALSELQNQPEE